MHTMCTCDILSGPEASAVAGGLLLLHSEPPFLLFLALSCTCFCCKLAFWFLLLWLPQKCSWPPTIHVTWLLCCVFPLMLISGRAVGPCPAFFPLFATTSLLPFQKLSSPWTQRITPPILSTWGLELFFSSEKGYHTSNQQRLRRLLREFFVGSCPGFCTEVGLFQSSTMQVCKSMDSVRC